MSVINREALYEKACDLEAQALAYVGKIAYDETKIEEWRIWSAILAERTAFKHDIFDAPEVKPESKWISVTERLPEDGGYYIVTENISEDGDKWVGLRWYSTVNGWKFEPVAWMPLPEPYQEGGEQE